MDPAQAEKALHNDWMRFRNAAQRAQAKILAHLERQAVLQQQEQTYGHTQQYIADSRDHQLTAGFEWVTLQQYEQDHDRWMKELAEAFKTRDRAALDRVSQERIDRYQNRKIVFDSSSFNGMNNQQAEQMLHQHFVLFVKASRKATEILAGLDQQGDTRKTLPDVFGSGAEHYFDRTEYTQAGTARTFHNLADFDKTTQTPQLLGDSRLANVNPNLLAPTINIDMANPKDPSVPESVKQKQWITLNELKKKII